MFALVVFILVYVTVLTSMFADQTDEFTADLSGGFNVHRHVEPEQPGRPRRARERTGRERGGAARHQGGGDRRLPSDDDSSNIPDVRIRPGAHRQRTPDPGRRRRLRQRRRGVRGGPERPEPRDRRRLLLEPGRGPARGRTRHRRHVHDPRPGERTGNDVDRRRNRPERLAVQRRLDGSRRGPGRLRRGRRSRAAPMSPPPIPPRLPPTSAAGSSTTAAMPTRSSISSTKRLRSRISSSA